jgi:uncharacterized protein (DUF2235 family)
MPTNATGPRQLIVCCDGTNNTLTAGQHDTNVLRLFGELRRQASEPRPEGSKPRVLYYDPGVGSPDDLPATGVVQMVSRKWDRIAGLASGQGVFENIAQAYQFLMREWRPGDEIWLFGFSRGAFTARSVSGMLNLFGLLRPEHDVLLPTLLRVYFASKDSSSRPVRMFRSLGAVMWGKAGDRTREGIATQVRRDFCSEEGRAVPVHFIGVWDTVESVGMPGFGLQISSDATVKGKRFRHVRHALSLDEHRRPFRPRLYLDGNGVDEAGQSVQQVWFRGVHSDVGGGYLAKEAGLADAALAWMVDEAIACGLDCRPQGQWPPATAARVAHDPVHETPWWAVLGLVVRTPDRVQLPTRVVKLAPVAHASAAVPVADCVWRRRRRLGSVLAAALLAAVTLAMSGYMLQSGSGLGAAWSFATSPAAWSLSMQSAVGMASAQATAWFDPAGPATAAAASGACPRWSLVWDTAFLACCAYLLARACGHAFTRAAGWRQVTDAPPSRMLRALGLALPCLVAGDLFENGCGLLAFSLGASTVHGMVVLWFGVLGALAKAAGGLGCVVLLAVGLRDRRR